MRRVKSLTGLSTIRRLPTHAGNGNAAQYSFAGSTMCPCHIAKFMADSRAQLEFFRESIRIEKGITVKASSGLFRRLPDGLPQQQDNNPKELRAS